MNGVIKEKYLSYATNVIFFGLILFYCGIYIFPDGGDIPRVFYILVMLPMLYIVFSLRKEFFKNHYIWLMMLLPVYLTISHFWAPEENIIRSSFFHLKKLVYFLFFIFSVFYIVEKKYYFLRTLLQFILIIGVFSSFISIVCFWSERCGVVSGRLASFSVQDINKAGAIYTVTMSLSAFFLTYGFSSIKDTYLIRLALAVCFVISFVAAYYAKTHATWFMLVILLFFSLMPIYSIRVGVFVFFAILMSFIAFFYFDGYNYLSQDSSFIIREKLVLESIDMVKDSLFFGIGMTHKLPLLGFPHPHNLVIDIFRFGGFAGLLMFIFPILYFLFKGMQLAKGNVLIRFCLAWLIASIAIMSVYGQQPITRPGGYIWFLYWMPLVLLTAEISRVKKIEIKNE